MSRKLLAMFLAMLMVFSLLPAAVFAEDAAEVPMGAEDYLYVDTNVDSSWKLAGPETAAMLVGAGGAKSSYTAKYANASALGVIVEVEGVPEGSSVQLTLASFKAKGNDTYENMNVRTDRVASGEADCDWGKPITEDGVYAMLRLPSEWAFWTNLFYARSLDEMSVVASQDIRIRVLGVAEMTGIDNNVSPAINNVTYLDSDKTTELGKVNATYTTGFNGRTANPVIFKLDAHAPEYVKEGYVDGDYTYTFDGWKNLEDDGRVDAVYGNVSVYPGFTSKHKDEIIVTFLGDGGVILDQVNIMKGSSAEYDGAEPTKGSTYDYEYFFEGWKDAEGNPVDLTTATFDADTTLTASFIEQLRLRLIIEPDKTEVKSGEKMTLTLKLNRSDIYRNGGLERIISGHVDIKYDSALFINDMGYNGAVRVDFNSVAEDGTVAQAVFAANAKRFAGCTFTLSGSVDTEDGYAKTYPESSFKATVVGQQSGTFFTDNAPIAINKPGEDGTIAQQDLMPEKALLDPTNCGITFVYKVEGADTEIIADNWITYMNGRNYSSGQWNKTTLTEDGTPPSYLELKNGYYYIYLNQNINGTHGMTPQSQDSFIIFAPNNGTRYATTRTATNNNENATFRMLAVVDNNLQPTVTFHDTDGSVLTAYQYKYTDIWRSYQLSYVPDCYQKGELLTPAEVFAAAQADVAEGEAEIILPAKDSGHKEVVYEFDCWVDAEGNPIEAVYMNCDAYPTFKMVDKRTQYKVEFRAYDDSLLYECVVPEGDTPVYPAEFGTPKKPSTDTNSYEFIGWSPAIEIMPETPEADGATAPDTVVYKAQYNEIERRYDVIYYAEDGTTVIDEDLHLVKGTASTTDVVPEKAADVQYNYTFEGWVDLEGKEVDLTKVTADMKVKPVFKATLNKYTVTFIDEDGESELGKSTVDYGTAATAPEATKERDEWYTYSFEKWVDEEGNEVSVTEVKGDMTVYAAYVPVFAPDAELYPDIQPPMPEWYAPAVEYVLVNGIMNGMTGGFSPDTTMSRAMVVTVLYRYMGKPDVELPETFANFIDNLDTASWYYDAVIWGAVNGVVNGRGNGIFDPDGNVTRQEFATILYRFSDEIMGEYMGYGRASLSSFYDRDDIASWAHTAVKWAFATAEDVDTAGSTAYNKTQYITGAGVMNGKVIFNPKANATRAQVATMLYRYITAERIPAKS